jgi:small-conductance mechanosensitive channel
VSRPTHVDPRGQRFAAAITSMVLALVLVLPTTAAVVLLAAQAVVFAVGASGNLHRTPYAVLFARLVRPRIGPPAEPEDARPPRFAQAVGLGFAVVALAGFLAGADVVGYVATAFALVAALLNAVVGFCLGCELYLLGRRLTAGRATA